MLCISALNLASRRSIFFFDIHHACSTLFVSKEEYRKIYKRCNSYNGNNRSQEIAFMSIASRIVLGSRFDDEFESRIIDADRF